MAEPRGLKHFEHILRHGNVSGRYNFCSFCADKMSIETEKTHIFNCNLPIFWKMYLQFCKIQDPITFLASWGSWPRWLPKSACALREAEHTVR